MGVESMIRAFISRALPAARAQRGRDGEPVRGGPYGDLYVQPLMPDMGWLADEGSYYTVNNGQTGIATAAAPTAFSATNPFLLVYNTESPSKEFAQRVLMDYATLVNTAVGTAGASVQFAVTLDQGNRYTSGGTELTANIRNVNGDESNGSVARIWAGNITASAATGAVRTVVGQRYMKGAIPVAGDTYSVKFGGVDAPSFFGVSTILFSLNNVPKIVIPPNWSMLLHLWLPSQSAASSYNPELGWAER